MHILETERLILKAPSAEDADFFLEIYNMPSFIRFVGDRKLRTLDDAKKYIEDRFLPQWQRLGFGNYVVLLKEGTVKIGAVGIFQRDGLDVHDIGFSFFEKFQGKGYAYEAAAALQRMVSEKFGIDKISAITTKDNFSSQRLIERLGLTFRNFVVLPDETEELMYYENDGQ